MHQGPSTSMPIPRRPLSILSVLSPLSPARFTNPSLPRSSFACSPQGVLNFDTPVGQPGQLAPYCQRSINASAYLYQGRQLHGPGFHGVPINDNYMASIKRTFDEIFAVDSTQRGREKRIRQSGGRGERTQVDNGSTSSSDTTAGSRAGTETEADGPKATFKDPSSFKRRWKYLAPRGAQLKPGEFQFTILSYNILAQGLLVGNPYLYKNINPLYLDWNYRRANLLQEMLNLNADILCLQEVEGEHFHDFFQPMLANHGYAAIYKQRTGDKTDGCAIFFKASCFQLVASKCVPYYRRNIPLLDRDNVGIIALLKTAKGPTQHLCVATTHLLFNPRRGDIKLAQLGLFLAEIDQISHYKTRKGGDCVRCPVILCGDMNSLPQSPMLRLICDGSLDFGKISAGDMSGQKEGQRGGPKFLRRPPIPAALKITKDCQYVSALERRTEEARKNGASQKEGHCQDDDEDSWFGGWERTTIKHPFLFSSVYSLDEDSKEVTSNHSRTNCMVDYIFYTPSTQADEQKRMEMEGKLELIASLQLFKDEDATKMGGLPNKIWSSDHFSLMASFMLR